MCTLLTHVRTTAGLWSCHPAVCASWHMARGRHPSVCLQCESSEDSCMMCLATVVSLSSGNGTHVGPMSSSAGAHGSTNVTKLVYLLLLVGQPRTMKGVVWTGHLPFPSSPAVTPVPSFQGYCAAYSVPAVKGTPHGKPWLP
jgi:hypothetical protein